MMIIIKCGDTFPKSCSLYSKDVDHCCLEALKTSKVHLLSGMKIEVFKSLKSFKVQVQNKMEKDDQNFLDLVSHPVSHWLKIPQNVALEFLNLGIFHKFLSK